VKTLYVETSALLAWLLGQKRGSEARAAIDAAETVVTSALTFAEIERALSRGVALGALREADARRARGVAARQRRTWIVMAITDDVLGRAGRPFPVEPLRTLDAIHVATALAFAEAFPDLEVLSVEERVTSNARALGL
jgi:predicted nucleic acid-binding protein